MSIEDNAQNDLALSDADAESVVGGARKKAKARKKVVRHSPPSLAIVTMAPMDSAPGPDGSGADVGAVSDDDC